MLKTALVFVLLAPLLGAVVNGLRWKSTHLRPASLIGLSSCFISFVSAVFLFFFLQSSLLPSQAVSLSFFEWFRVGSLAISFSFLVDPLSVLMLLVITGVGFLIHIFSVYYMSHDPRPAKYFSYLNLFIFSMVTLVLADNLILMFLGWEGVGLCSYLLIGFWFTDKQKAAAGMKAFIVNRIGDIGLLLGIFFLFQQFASLNFHSLSEAVAEGSFNLSLVKWACFCLFIGAIGKSAQIPLYVWLPSAMAGPTPVSALIHAATMVTAGIYLIVRLSFLFTLAPEVLTLISWTGAVTAFVTALIACAQSDIKKVLAYSTVSQLGYMFVATGVGAFTASLFHLLTHAFFKALLFLSAGAIIHALNGEQNIYRMGGLRKYLPVTYLCFLIGFLALIGLPPLSGFFSKDEILWSAFAEGAFGVFGLSVLTALITTFYMSRLFALVFYGQKRFSPELTPYVKGFFARFPLIALAGLSVFGGLLGIPHLISEHLPAHPPHWIEVYLKPVVVHNPFKGSLLTEMFLMLGSTVLILFVLGTTLWLYLKKKKALENLKQKNKPLFTLFEEALRVDAFYQAKLVQPVLNLSRELWRGMDVKLIQGFIVLIQKWLLSLKNLFENVQNGKMQNYILFMILGMIVCVLSVLLR